MEMIEYIENIKKDISNILEDNTLSNYKNQIFAWKLNATFNRTYKEEYLWNRALFLSSNSCLIIENQDTSELTISALKYSAEIYEYLSDLPDINNKYDKEYLLLLSALCYDLAGYQANAYCLAGRIQDYKLETEENELDLEIDNIVLEQIKFILLKKIPLAKEKINNYRFEQKNGILVFEAAILKWFNSILQLEESDYLIEVQKIYKYLLYSGNIHLSHLMLLLKTRILMFKSRGIWENLKKIDSIKNNIIWQKYAKLLTNDYYSTYNIKDINIRNSKYELWTSQLRAIEGGLLNKDENFIVQMPTSAGKTFIAELSILKHLTDNPGGKCIYIAPFRALSNEKEIEINQYLSKLGFSISSLLGSYEIDDFQEVILEDTDVLIATPEKIDLLLRINNSFFEKVNFIVVDEGHIVGEISSRASLLEFLIIRIKIKFPKIRILYISAVMPNSSANEYSLWLSGKTSNVLRSLQFKESKNEKEWEPTRKIIGSFRWEGDNGNITFNNVKTQDEITKVERGATLYSYLKNLEFKGRFPNKKIKKETVAALAYKLSTEASTLVFCGQVRRIKSIANSLLDFISILKEEEVDKKFQIKNTKESSYYSEMWFGNDSYITKAINRGIGIHFGDMPEQVRKAVENDFNKGELSLLLSTNTIGQGINFPIKNLLIYETRIGYNSENEENINITHRDFWNIVGRAGRAGKETEGKIIFVIQSFSDSMLYESYIKKERIEEANSLLFRIYDGLMNNRFSQEIFFNYFSLLSEPYLLDLMTEEILGTDFEDIIEQIVDNSLFKIQIENKKQDISFLKKTLKKKFIELKEKSSIHQLTEFAKTGFSYRSNKLILDYIDLHKERLEDIIENDDYLALIDEFLNLLSSNPLEELFDEKIHLMGITFNQYSNVIKKWIQAESISNLKNEWVKLGLNEEKLSVFISRALFYLFPWGISTFLILIKYNLEIAELPFGIKNVVSYIKYGVDNPTSCLANLLGVRSRETSLLLFEKSNKLSGKAFIKWFANLELKEIDEFNVPHYDKINIKQVVLNISSNNINEKTNEIVFIIKGTNFNEEWRNNSKLVKLGDELRYKRDLDNKYDPYAIIIQLNNSEIGFVPREYSKYISSEVDINGTEYTVNVNNVIENVDYNSIQVTMNVKNKFN